MMPDENPDPPVRYEVADSVATITLCRPSAMNSLDNATKDSLLEAVRKAAYDAEVRAVLLTGTGRAFCVGQDLREHATNLQTSTVDEVWSTVERHYTPIATTIARMAKPVVAAVNGVAAGAGMSLAMLCDLRIASDRASFNTAFTGVGLSCDTGCSWTLPRLVGPTKAMELLLLPQSIDAATALELHLVNRVVPGDDLAGEAGELCRRLAEGPTVAFAAVKRSLAYSATHSLADTMAFEAQMMAWTGATADHQAAVTSFLGKQTPVFEGR